MFSPRGSEFTRFRIAESGAVASLTSRGGGTRSSACSRTSRSLGRAAGTSSRNEAAMARSGGALLGRALAHWRAQAFHRPPGFHKLWTAGHAGHGVPRGWSKARASKSKQASKQEQAKSRNSPEPSNNMSSLTQLIYWINLIVSWKMCPETIYICCRMVLFPGLWISGGRIAGLGPLELLIPRGRG
jgi:hypothetical protein